LPFLSTLVEQQRLKGLQCRAADQRQAPEQQPPAAAPASRSSGGGGPQLEQQQLVGEDAAVFNPADQSLRSWGLFFAILAGVSAILYPVRAMSCLACCASELSACRRVGLGQRACNVDFEQASQS
jgi:hypothetical protein